VAEGYVYFVKGETSGLVKIGHTSNHPSARLVALQIGSPEKLVPVGVLPGTKQREKKLHARYAEYRSHGEWFRVGRRLAVLLRSRVRPWPEMPPPKQKPKPDPAEVAEMKRLKTIAKRARLLRARINAAFADATDDELKLMFSRNRMPKLKSEMDSNELNQIAESLIQEGKRLCDVIKIR
jgi:hypothetical protein